MNFDDTPEEATWREHVRAYIGEHRDQLAIFGAGGRRGEDLAIARMSQATLYDGGFVGVTWPREYGGQGGTPMQESIVYQEMSRAGVSQLIGLIGIGLERGVKLMHAPALQGRNLDVKRIQSRLQRDRHRRLHARRGGVQIQTRARSGQTARRSACRPP